jgi:hypothetical protein
MSEAMEKVSGIRQLPLFSASACFAPNRDLAAPYL